MLAGKV